MTNAQVADAFDLWDESEEYWQTIERNSKAQDAAIHFCLTYGMYAPRGFDWSDATAQQVLTLSTTMTWHLAELERLLGDGMEMEELLAAIEHLRLLNVEASRWVRRILAEYASTYDPMEASTSGGDVLEFLNEATYEIPELMRKRLESPIFFGQICLEFERLLLKMQSGKPSA
jgi:hypothetical protein